ncbi:hypothetical protein OG21DRAFT_1494674 [Imleria badia]|nr:hypothetical protein OG21DRAFT_1494674 [Imleria badia]
MEAAAFTFQVPSSISMPPKSIPPFYIPPPENLCDDTESHHAQSPRTRFRRASPSDDFDLHPLKRPKQIMTSFSYQRTKEVEDLFSLRQFQLARASRNAIAAQADYRRLRVHEIEFMHKIALAEVEEVEARLEKADIKLGQTRQVALSTGAYTEEDLNTHPTTRSPDEVYSDVGSSVGLDDNSGCSTPMHASDDG